MPYYRPPRLFQLYLQKQDRVNLHVCTKPGAKYPGAVLVLPKANVKVLAIDAVANFTHHPRVWFSVRYATDHQHSILKPHAYERKHSGESPAPVLPETERALLQVHVSQLSRSAGQNADRTGRSRRILGAQTSRWKTDCSSAP